LNEKTFRRWATGAALRACARFVPQIHSAAHILESVDLIEGFCWVMPESGRKIAGCRRPNKLPLSEISEATMEIRSLRRPTGAQDECDDFTIS
jgi:hypothetical protein